MIVVAMSDIKSEEEVTLTYTCNTQTSTERKRDLVKYGFECDCALCKADATLDGSALLLRNEISSTLMEMIKSQLSAEGAPVAEHEATMRKYMQTYDALVYKGIPYLQMAEPLYGMAHVYLGRIPAWPGASSEAKVKARDCFTACLQVGLGIKLAMNPSTKHYELVFLKYSQADDCGILSLVGLAELAFLAKDINSAASLLACAKKLYKIRFGEDTTFGDHHLDYTCKAVKPCERCAPMSAKAKAAAVAEPMPIPWFLR